MKLNFSKLIFLIALNCSLAQSQITHLDGKIYIYENNKWYLADEETSEKYELNMKSLTVKLNENISRDEFESFIALNNITIKRENILGFIDLILSENIDCFEMYNIFKK